MTDFMHGMRRQSVRANGIRINTWIGGSGPALVLLHGYPQTAQMWHKMAPTFIKEFSVVCPDLRGYGASSKPRVWAVSGLVLVTQTPMTLSSEKDIRTP